MVFARFVRRIASPHRNRAEVSVVFRHCICAFARVETVVTGCDLKQYAICMFLFIFHNRPFFDLVFGAFRAPNRVGSAESAETSVVYQFCVWAIACALMLASDCDVWQHAICIFIFSFPV